jgi:hypothetical protein
MDVLKTIKGVVTEPNQPHAKVRFRFPSDKLECVRISKRGVRIPLERSDRAFIKNHNAFDPVATNLFGDLTKEVN